MADADVAVDAETVGVGNIGTVSGGTFIFNFAAVAAPPKPAAASGQIPPCPYKGLAFFGPADADRFFGRDAAVARLEQTVARQSFTALVGASGSGKSSVVLAGLAPHLHASGDWQVTYFRIGAEANKDPFLALARALTPLMGGPGLALEEKQRLADGLAAGKIALPTALGECRTNNPGKRILVIADQFEEVFTLVAEDARARFIDLLLAGFPRGGANPPDVALVLTLRADFYEKALLHRGLAEALQDRVVNLGPMSRDELREAIEAPAKPVTFEKGLVDALLDEIATQPSALPLLQFALTQMWGRLDTPEMTFAAYEAIGGVKGALRRRAEAIYARLTDDGRDAVAVARFRALFTRLVSFGEGALDTRRAAQHDELGPEVWGLAQQLAGEHSRLVVVAAPAPGKETVEIAHEALIANWPALRGAIDANREFGAWLKQLRVFLEEYRKMPGDEGALLRGGPLAVALDWLEKRRDELSEEERGFVDKSRQGRDAALAAEAARRGAERRRARVIAGVSLAAAVAMAGLAGEAAWQWRDAERQRAAADANAKEALQQKFAADAARKEAEREKGIAETKEREAVEDKAAAEAARTEAEQQKLTAEANAKEAEKQKASAEKSLRLATEAANGLVFNLAQKFENVTGVPVALVKDVLDRARDLQQKLIDAGQTSPDLLRSEAVALDEMCNTLLTQGDTQGALEDARKAADIFEALLKQAPESTDYQRELSVSYEKVGDVHVAQGQLAAALESYKASLAIRERLAKSDPGNADWQRDLSVSYEKVGNVQVAQGQLAAALDSYKADLAIAERLANSDPGNAGWQKDLAFSYEHIGNVEQAQGRLAPALSSYQSEFAILDRLAKSDVGNASWQRALSVAYEKVGDVQVAQGQLAAALDSYKADLAITERLAKSDPGNAGWQEDLAFSYEHIGIVEQAQGQLAPALSSYQSEFAILDRLAKSDIGNASWQRALSVAYEKVGGVQVAQGQLAAALDSYKADLAIAERLAKSDPGNADWQRDLSVSYESVGDVLVAQGQLAAALDSYSAYLAIAERLAKSDPGNAGWQRDLSVSYNKVGDAQVAQGQPAAALDSYKASLAIIERLAKSDPGNAGWQRDLSVSYEKVGDVQVAQGQLAAALDSCKASLAITERLAKSDPGNAGWQRDLSVSYANLAYVYLKLRDTAQARPLLQAGRGIMARLVAASPDYAQWKGNLAWFEQQLAALKP